MTPHARLSSVSRMSLSRAARIAAAAVLTAAGAIAAVTISGAPAGAAVPVPEKDPFYAVPANIATYANGAVIASRSIAPSAFLLPLPAKAWQVKYRSTDGLGAPTADVTTILVPLLPWTGTGARPLVSYQTAEDGVAGKCAPSYALRAGLTAASSNASAEMGLVLQLLLRGWAVTVPDYEGPQSEFLVAGQEGNGVLDAVRASLHFTPAGLSPSTKVALWGYSGGSLASDLAAQFQPTYAPELHLTGVALGGFVADIHATILDFSGSAFGGAIAMGVNGPMRGYPDLHLENYLNDYGKKVVAAAAGDCINDAVARRPFLSIAQIEAYPGAFESPLVRQLLTENSPIGIEANPQTVIYDYHAILDELAPIGPDRAQMRRYCSAGLTVQHVEHLLGEHISETVTGAPGAIAFLAQRFAGATPINTCATIPAP